jgi:hypothetical protein
MSTDAAADTGAVATKATILGPFLGYVTPASVKVWLHLEGGANSVYVTMHRGLNEQESVASGELALREDRLFTDCITIEGLSPNTKYYYRLWTNPAHSIPLDLQGLTHSDLFFRTLSDDPQGAEQIDFLLMSCHNPFAAGQDGFDGHAVWADIPQIIASESNKSVRFALLVGDQVYADEWQDRVLNETDERRRLRLYLEVYRKFWSNIHYRRVLCALPAMMIWDDHDITDGWGSTADSFDEATSEFKPEWQRLFKSAFTAFDIMQASRNPPLLIPGETFDCCFKIGKWGFVLADLRTNRNLRKKQLMTGNQSARIKQWIEENKADLRAVFVVSPVVFSHGTPVIDDLTVRFWPYIMNAVDWVAKRTKWGKGMRIKFSKSLGDIRDDILDSWGVDANADQTDNMLDYLFALQNDGDHPLGIVILSGDIHTSGYATIYSSSEKHKERSSIAHITSSSVSYAPFNWLLEAVYRHASKTVTLGKNGIYSSQISHHFCARSVAVLSVRPKGSNDHQLKVKYYLEGYPEPQILMFDLDRTSHRENIAWVAQEKLFSKDYAPTPRIDVDAVLRERAQASDVPLNYRESIVDLLKLLGMESSLGARKRLAQQLGYEGALNGSAEMNVWLHKRVVQKFADSGGKLAEDFQLNQ